MIIDRCYLLRDKQLESKEKSQVDRMSFDLMLVRCQNLYSLESYGRVNIGL
jgi:hypothetical protein